jgi:hypothetical protein
MHDDAYRWIPPDNVTNHGEAPLTDQDDFFAPPPPEIGEVVTAYTTLRTDKHPWPVGNRVGLGFLIGSVLGVIAFLIGGVAEAELGTQIFLAAVGMGVGLLIGLASTGFSHRCTYVGREGVAEFKCSGSRDRITTSNIFPFSEAAELRTTQVRRYVNGVYQGTNYNFHFAGQAELAWSNYLLQFVKEQLDRDGFLHFNLGGADYVRVGPDFLELRVGGQTTECATSDIGALSLQAGMFTVKRRDAKEGWFTSKGVFKFNYNALANAQLFLFLLERLTGLRPF